MIVVQMAKMVKVLEMFGLVGLAKRAISFLFKGEELFFTDRVYDSFTKNIRPRLILNIPGRGCAWFKASGGCTMCGFNRKLEEVNRRWKFSSSDLIGFFKIAEILSRSEKPELLYIYNGGSFLNENEIPLETQLAVAKAVRIHPTLKVLFVESRPEFINGERLSRFLEVLGPKKLEVGIGLEAVTNKVREEYIHKGFSLPAYEKAVEMSRSRGVRVLTYVFLKPLGLSEREAIEEAIRTIKYAFEAGSDEISLSCAFVQEGTKMEEVYMRGEFRPPWLWSIIEVVKRTAHLGPVRVGSFKDEPLPIAIPHNCSRCSQRVEETLQKYNLTRQISTFNGLNCECREQWLKETKRA
jgi:radical SAM enzyme (TIGR01210 family)